MDRAERSVNIHGDVDMFLCYWLYDRVQTQFDMVMILGVIVSLAGQTPPLFEIGSQKGEESGSRD